MKRGRGGEGGKEGGERERIEKGLKSLHNTLSLLHNVAQGLALMAGLPSQQTTLTADYFHGRLLSPGHSEGLPLFVETLTEDSPKRKGRRGGRK